MVCPMCWRLAVAVLHAANLPGTVALQVPSTCPVSPGAHSSCFLKTGLLTSKAGWNLSSPKVILWIVFLWVKRLQVSTCCNSWYVLVMKQHSGARSYYVSQRGFGSWDKNFPFPLAIGVLITSSYQVCLQWSGSSQSDPCWFQLKLPGNESC